MTLDFGALHGEGVATASDTIYPKTKPKVRAKGQAKVRARRKPERRLVIRDKKQAIQYSNIIIVALQEALSKTKTKTTNPHDSTTSDRPRCIDDDKYKSDIREPIDELKRLNDLLERKSLRERQRLSSRSTLTRSWGPTQRGWAR